ncbi:SAICAR synthase-like protein [Sporormia fimetaria CBS 119925]|uniref:Kinase n=1 Tax=Sporormia fimetaria CBS 119925 TaxID=1340428 RepID=A0A6A6V123_9PLEO|nr:SAICAR synthase-like protein [Sporormia fimetaria CBS 119925]
MTKPSFDPANLQAFGHAAAGHDGVMSDSSGAVVVKPCTQAEVSFYETVTLSHPDLSPHLPTFMGTLSLSADQSAATDIVPDSGVIETATGTERLHGKKLDTELHIVLENITHGFTKPNVLDLKLGARLWDEDAKPEKRARLDEVSQKSTSGSLGFRIAGMRTWMGGETQQVPEELKQYVEDNEGVRVYNKMYGRKFNAQDVVEGFWAYVLPGGAEKASQKELERAREILSYFLGEIRDIQKAFEAKESRMYSASLLLVYEGDINEYEKTKEKLTNLSETNADEDEDEEEEDLPQLATVKVIDFAHATFQPGQGSDENAIRGMRSTNGILEKMLSEVEKRLD